MNKDEAHKILSTELQKFRDTPYVTLRNKLGNQGCWEVIGPSGATYQIEVDILCDDPRSKAGNLRIIGSIDDGRFPSAFSPLSEDFIMTPDGRFVSE